MSRWAAPALALVLIVAGALVLRAWRESRARVGGPSGAFPDSIASLDPDSAYQRGFYLDRAGRSGEGLPYVRFALTRPSQPALELVGYSDILHNHALENRRRGDTPQSATRSSFERVALMRESFAQLATAESIAARPPERALVHVTRAHHLLIWGLPLDALAEYRKAQAFDPSRAPEAAGLAWLLQHPERGTAAGPAPGSAPGATAPPGLRGRGPSSP
jgi:hypothetical protein